MLCIECPFVYMCTDTSLPAQAADVRCHTAFCAAPTAVCAVVDAHPGTAHRRGRARCNPVCLHVCASLKEPTSLMDGQGVARTSGRRDSRTGRAVENSTPGDHQQGRTCYFYEEYNAKKERNIRENKCVSFVLPSNAPGIQFSLVF